MRRYFLTKSVYLNEKRRICLEFSNEKEKKSFSFPFVPYFYLSLEGLNKKTLFDLINLYDRKRFRTKLLKNNILKITALNFTELKKLYTLIISSTKLNPLLLSPERQFLIERDWSYFDCFKAGGDSLKKINSFTIPKINLFGLQEDLELFLKGLMKEERESAVKIIESIILSNILSVPFTELPAKKEAVAEKFFEKIFFRNSFALNKGSFLKTPRNKFNAPKGVYENVTELDFSSVFSMLMTFPFFNTGFEAMNCSCCKPRELTSSNISPSSLAEVKFLFDGIYFESLFKEWAYIMDSFFPGKEKRERMKREWCLDSIPLGPFHKDQVARVPLIDAVQLVEKNQAVILEDHYLVWFCRKNESFLSREIVSLNKEIVEIEKTMEEKRKTPQKNPIISSLSLEEEPQFIYLDSFCSILKEILSLIPLHLCNPFSKFYESGLGNAIKCIQANAFERFKEFVDRNGEKTLLVDELNVFVSTNSALHLAQGFSIEERLPSPQIKKTYKRIYFT